MLSRFATLLPPAAPNALDAEIGPFYDTAAVATLLGGVSEQALEARRKKHTLLAVRTADGRWAYPTFQFTGDAVDPRLVPAIQAFWNAPAWSAALWFVTPNPDLDDATPLVRAREERPPETLTASARRTVHEWQRHGSRRVSGTPTSAPASPRSTIAQAGPPPSLQGIPTTRPAASRWYREHGHRVSSPDGGCWYYAALPADPTTGGRFDVPAPAGTCCFADRPLVAAMERVERFTAQHKPVPADLPATAVNLLAKRAATHFGITGELFTTPDHSVPQAWAHAIHDQGHPSLVYTPRSSPSGRATVVFGPRGPRPTATTSAQPLADVLRSADVPIAAIPPASAVRFVSPPTP